MYNGEFRACKRAGRGTMADGEARYQGDWADDKRNGNGTMVYARQDGDVCIPTYTGRF